MARSGGSTGAVRQSARTVSTVSAESNATVATAPWDSVQNTHWFRDDTKAANSSRSATDQSEGPRITS
jgi:hypothetical protein